MKTVVTGGAGFIGSHLVKRLLDEGRDVVIADDFSRGSRLNLSDLGVQVESQKIDLSEYEQALKVIDGADVVFHLAARVGSIEYLHRDELSELQALQTNLVVDVNVFRACLETKVKKLIYASSVSVYPIDLQQSHDVILSEDDLRYVSPEGGYGWAKLIGEIQPQWMKKIKVGIARIFNVYGENEEPDENAHVIPALIRKAILYPKEEFRVWGNGDQTRCFLYVADAVNALMKIEEKASIPPIIVNVGSDEAVAIKMIAEKIAELSGKDMKIVYDSTKPVGPLSRTADLSRARALLEWQPKTSLDEGLKRTYFWAEKRLRA